MATHVRMRPAALLLAVFPIAIVTAACGGSSTSTNVTAPSDTRCQATVTNSSSSFPAAGGTGTLSVSVARECAWSAGAAASWLAITAGAQGQGDGTVTYRVAENSDPVARTGGLSVAERRMDVSQQAAPCRYSVSAASTDPVPAEGGELVVSVRTHAACNWTASSDVTWATVAPASGRGEAGVQVSVMPNPGLERRIDVTVAGERITAVQQPRLTTPAPNPAPAPNPTPSPNPAPSPNPGPNPAPTPTPSPAPSPTPGGEIDLEGTVRSLSGACPLLTFRVGDRTVRTTEDTRFRRTSCERLRDGDDVVIEGVEMSDGSVRADRITRD